MTMAKVEKSHIERLADMLVESSRGRGLYPVYSEFVATTAVAIAQACGNDTSNIGAKVREQSDDDGEMPLMIAELIMAVEDAQYCDILGDLFMRLNLGSQAGGQFFTPTHLAHLCGDIAMPENKSFVSALDRAMRDDTERVRGSLKKAVERLAQSIITPSPVEEGAYGAAWPRFADGAPVVIGDRVKGVMCDVEVASIVFRADCIVLYDSQMFHYVKLDGGERAQRPDGTRLALD